MAWLSVFVSVLTLLAVCRITRLVTEDTITQPIRRWLDHKASPHAPTRPGGRAAVRPAGRTWRYADKLVNCPWCAGFWVSAAVVLAYFRCWLGFWPHTLPTVFAYAAAVFACSWASAILADWLDSPPPPRVLNLSVNPVDVTTRQGPPTL